MEELFDHWPDKYEQWFQTPIGRLVEECENRLILEMLQPLPGDRILDAGCGSGVFTRHLSAAGVQVDGLEISLPMLQRAREKLSGYPFRSIQGDMRHLPFQNNRFDKVLSVTAIEYHPLRYEGWQRLKEPLKQPFILKKMRTQPGPERLRRTVK